MCEHHKKKLSRSKKISGIRQKAREERRNFEKECHKKQQEKEEKNG